MKYRGYDGEKFETVEQYIRYLESYINMLYGIFDTSDGIQDLITSYKEKNLERGK